MYTIEVRCEVKEQWVPLSMCKTQERAEDARKSAFRRGLDARIVREVAKGKREVML